MKNILFKSLAIYLFFHFASAFSCHPCGGLESLYFEVIGLQLVNYQSPENSSDFVWVELSENDSVVREQYVLGMEIEADYFSNVTIPVFENPFIQSALACSPAPPEATELITNITITSSADLVNSQGETLIAGTSLNDVFLREHTTFTVTSLLFDGNWAPMEYGERLILSANPTDETVPHQFTVEYELDSGNTFTATSKKIFLSI